MTPKYEPVQAVRIRASCGCGGEYIATGQDDLTNGMFGHRCNACRSEIKSKTKFPAIEHFNEAEFSALIGN
jgi:hypothetical protein